MPRSPWLTPRLLLASTALAALAAVATYALLADGDDQVETDGTIALEPSDEEPSDDPAFTTFEGAAVRLSSLEGAPLLVNFFASSCLPCIEEMPAFEEVFQEVGAEVRFLGLAVQDRTADALELVERTGVTYPTALDERAEVITALGGAILPTTVLLDAEGGVVTVHSGALDADELRRLLADELGVDA